MNHVFGPVRSRRLGMSLGVDLVPWKTCSLDCAYCECGITTEKTSELKQWVDIQEVLSELDEFLKENKNINFVTLSGSGEPLLHSDAGKVIDFVRNNYPEIKTAILTNSTTLHIPGVIDSIMNAHLIMPSLDAVSEDVFIKLNRPADGITADMVIEGISLLVKQFRGEIRLEIFLADGINNTEAELSKLAETVKKLGIRNVQLNSLDRPGALPWVKPLSGKQLLEAAAYFENPEIITRNWNKSDTSTRQDNPLPIIISGLKRRPQTLQDIMAVTGFDEYDAEKIMELALRSGSVKTKLIDGTVFYTVE
ncbi:MAG: radical SAM protein [Deltaproteobacteria bacterium]|nr:radical SAM protein [Deltaproteobacteria bacterium]